jgi:hypothetical protein
MKAFIYKEWLKLRLWWTLLLAAITAYALYISLTLRSINEFNDAAIVWNYWLFKGWLFFGRLEYIPPALGIVLAALQFLPEMQNRRIRLVFHLPVREERALLQHLLIGGGLLLCALLPALGIITTAAILNFPAEMRGVILLNTTPWLLSGLAAYLFATTAILETNWRHRVTLLLAGVAFAKLLHQSEFYNTYQRVLPFFILWTLLLFLLPLLSGHRFRKGLN